MPSDTSQTLPRARVVKRVVGQQIPDDILHNEDLQQAISLLPAHYNFEIHKTLWRLRVAKAKHVALQFPEGLLMYACIIADILETYGGVEDTFIMGDVTYGACCVDDFSAAALGADFLVHYGHSCLVPVDVTEIPCMYVFVDISISVDHLVGTIKKNFQPDSRLVLAGTIQFASSMHAARAALAEEFPNIVVPQSRPLSPGEVLGCTAPKLEGEHDAMVFVSDGRFHLEALMIANPTLKAFRYDPYVKTLTEEEYDQEGMRSARQIAVQAAMKADKWGLVLGTLGRQGNPAILERLQTLLQKKGRSFVTVLLSEVTPQKLKSMSHGVEAWVQIACPRLSIDWGDEFAKPTLNPYEAYVALGETRPWWGEDDSKSMAGSEEGVSIDYPMDYYAASGGPHRSSYHKPRARVGTRSTT